MKISKPKNKSIKVMDISDGVLTFDFNGRKYLIDEEFGYLLEEYGWMYTSTNYLQTRKPYEFKKRILIHRIIAGVDLNDRNQVVDHINKDVMDNRKENLRICTQKENSFNIRKLKEGTSSYKGVHWCNTKKRFISKLAMRKSEKTIGYFDSEHVAALAYNLHTNKIAKDFFSGNKIKRNDLLFTERDKKKIYKMLTGKDIDLCILERNASWSFFFCEDRKMHIFGGFETKLDAIKCYNEFITKNMINKPLNEIDEEKINNFENMITDNMLRGEPF